MIDEATIQKAVELLLEAAPGARVIVFGSQARGEADERSDLDLLVIEPEVKTPMAEMVRLGGVLGELGIAAEELRRVLPLGPDHYSGKIWGPFSIDPRSSTIDGNRVSMRIT